MCVCVSVCQYNLLLQPGENSQAGWRNRQSNCRWAREASGLLQSLSDCLVTRSGFYLQRTLLGQLQLLPQPGLDPRLSSWKAWWLQGKSREIDAI